MQKQRALLHSSAAVSTVVLLGGLLSACKPELGAPPSLIAGPQLLDLHSNPAEAKPGTDVALNALLVDPTGTLGAPVAWTRCVTPKPPAESNAVSRVCIDQPDDDAPVPGTAVVKISSDACSLFGPLTPPAQAGQPAVRPRDPDPTGGFYQPIRAAVRGLPGAEGDLLGFALVRVSCALANAPADVAKEFNDPDTGYHANIAPTLASVTATDDAGTAFAVIGPDPGVPPPTPPQVRPGEAITLRATWPAEAAEVFPVFDIATRTLIDTREAMHVSWFATGGELLHDRTGRASDDVEPYSDNTWSAPTANAPMTVHFWVILRDSRGGSVSASFDLMTSP